MSRRLLDKLPKMMEGPEFVDAWEESSEEFSIARKAVYLPVQDQKLLAKALLEEAVAEATPFLEDLTSEYAERVEEK